MFGGQVSKNGRNSRSIVTEPASYSIRKNESSWWSISSVGKGCCMESTNDWKTRERSSKYSVSSSSERDSATIMMRASDRASASRHCVQAHSVVWLSRTRLLIDSRFEWVVSFERMGKGKKRLPNRKRG
jgi:hypothetical protein